MSSASPRVGRVPRAAAAVAMRLWLRLYHRLAVVGRDNLPVGRSFVMVSNHASHLDMPCLLSALPLALVSRAFPVAASDYFAAGAVRAALARLFLNALPFDRRLGSRDSLAECEDVLAVPGNVLLLFPEGTRRSAAEPAEFKPGVAYLVAGRDIPVVPCHLSGTAAALPKGSAFPRPRSIRLTIGAPRDYAHLPPTRQGRRDICRDLRDAVVSLGRPSPIPFPPPHEVLWSTPT